MLAGCQEILYTNLEEQEANEIVSILRSHAITAYKTIEKEGAQVTVDKDDFSRSVKILNAQGYPRHKFSTFEQLFPQGGLVSTPGEERMRYTYALSQELAATISLIEGVVTARVHIVMPPANDTDSKIKATGAASVFVKHESYTDPSVLTPQIKNLVANSIGHVPYDKIALFLTASQRYENDYNTHYETLGGIFVRARDVSTVYGIIIVIAGVFVGLLGALGFVLWRQKRFSVASSAASFAAGSAASPDAGGESAPSLPADATASPSQVVEEKAENANEKST